jgi:hypothetical protein
MQNKLNLDSPFSNSSGIKIDSTRISSIIWMRLVCEPGAGSGERGKRERGAGIVVRNPKIDKFH